MLIILGAMLVVFVCIGIFLHIKSPIVHTVIAGDVRTERRTTPTAPLKITNNFIYKGNLINPNNFYVGKVKGDSMAGEGLIDGQIFFAEENDWTEKVGDIFVLETPKERINAGVHKLRKIVSINKETGVIMTTSCSLDKQQKKPSKHCKDDLVALVCYIPIAA